MDNINHAEIFFNRAEIKGAEPINCENCFEQVVFLLRDDNHLKEHINFLNNKKTICFLFNK